MAPASYLMHVNSRPKVSDELWKEWYTTEHIPDLMGTGAPDRVTFYEEVARPNNANPDHPMKFLALYQTQFPEMMKSDLIPKGNIRLKSQLFAKEGGEPESFFDNGEFDIRYYELIQEYDPFGTGEKSPPQMLTVEMHPMDVDDFERWYREEHLDLLKELPGYRRTLRYKLGPKHDMSRGDRQPPYLAIHEIDDLSGFGGQEAKKANTTPWTLKNIENSDPFVVRGWKLVYS